MSEVGGAAVLNVFPAVTGAEPHVLLVERIITPWVRRRQRRRWLEIRSDVKVDWTPTDQSVELCVMMSERCGVFALSSLFISPQCFSSVHLMMSRLYWRRRRFTEVTFGELVQLFLSQSVLWSVLRLFLIYLSVCSVGLHPVQHSVCPLLHRLLLDIMYRLSSSTPAVCPVQPVLAVKSQKSASRDSSLMKPRLSDESWICCSGTSHSRNCCCSLENGVVVLFVALYDFVSEWRV